MTLIVGNIQDVGYDGINGTLRVWAGFRPEATTLIAPVRREWAITNGQIADGVDIMPGPVQIQIEAGLNALKTVPAVIPDAESVTIQDLFLQRHVWTPTVVTEVAALTLRAEAAVGSAEAAAERAEDAATNVDEAIAGAADQVVQAVEQDRVLAEQAAGTATSAASQTAADRSHVDIVREELDQAYADSDAGQAMPPRLTEAALNATYAAKGFVGSTPPAALTAVKVQDEVAATGGIRPCGTLPGGEMVGYSGSTGVFLSTDDGLTWTQRGVAPLGQVQEVYPAPNDKHVVVTSQAVYLVSNLLSGTMDWGTAKVTVNGQARFTRFCSDFDPVSGKGIVSQYGPGAGQAFVDSRYAHVTLDGGETWHLAYDSVALFGETEANGSHVHGCCYDPWEDTFYVIEGHTGAGAGIYRASAATVPAPTGWLFNDGYHMYSAPTNIVATDNGIVLASDDPLSGLLGISRVGPQEDRKIIRTWSWRSRQDGVIGFGQHAQRDPETGIVYVTYQSSYADLPPIIVGGTATVGALVWEYDGQLGGSTPQLQSLALGAGGKLMASAFVDGRREIITGWRPGHGQSRTANAGGVEGGTAVVGSSMAIGPRSTTGDHNRAMAIGVEASAFANSLAIGYGARSEATQVVAIGQNVVVSGGGSVVVGQAAESYYGSGVAIGQNAKATQGGQAVAVGGSATAWTQGTTVGNNATVGATRGTAIGQGATVAAGHTDGVALGASTATSRGGQVNIGARHLASKILTTDPANTGTGEAFMYWFDNAGVLELRVKQAATVYTVWTAAPTP